MRVKGSVCININRNKQKLVNSSFYWPSKSIKSARYQVKILPIHDIVRDLTTIQQSKHKIYDDSYDKECKTERWINTRTS